VEGNNDAENMNSGLTTKEYYNRLVRDKKEIYKDPPMLPPLGCYEIVPIGDSSVVVPKRNKARQDRTIQDKRRQGKTRQVRTKEEQGQAKTRQGKTRQEKTKTSVIHVVNP
jgi:hypothetical protein